MNIMEISDTVEQISSLIKPVSDAIHRHPELGFAEHEACRLQLELLRSQGFRITSPYGGLDTAYRADFGIGEPVFAIMCEYDALPEIGHACGHNLICAAGLAAGITARKLMEKYQIPGTVAIIGTPAEETLGGKVEMLRSGAFEGISAVALCHPGPANALDPGDMAVSRYDVTFRGKPSHAAAAPEEGINALDAMNLLFSGIGYWRQQMPKGGMVHGIISAGGNAPNIIPDHTEAFFYLRSRDNATQQRLAERFSEIARGAAIMTGCQYEVTERKNPYSADKPNRPLREAVFSAMEESGMAPFRDFEFSISTDYADVSLVIPAVNFFFDVTGGKPVALHSREFAVVAGSKPAFDGAMKAAAVIAAATLRYLNDSIFRNEVAADFKRG